MKRLLSKNAPYLLAALLLLGVGLLIPKVGITDLGLLLVILVAVLLVLFSGRHRCTGFLSWKPEYSVGIDVIDEQHINLLNLINNLRAAVLCDTGPDFERGALDALIDYTQGHLKFEEELMREHDFLDYEGHKAQHDQMIVNVESYLTRYEKGGNEVLPEVADYLQMWLIQHIQVTDKKLCDFLRSKKVVV